VAVESDLSRLTALFRRHQHLKYVVASAVLVALVIVVILFSWRSDNRKTAAAAATQEPKVEVAATVDEGEPAQPEESESPTTRNVGHRARSASRGPGKRSASARAGSPARKATAVGDDPFEEASANTRERAAPVEAPSARRGRPGAAGGGSISQSQISEVVRNRDNQTGLKTCYERALKRDGRLRTGRLDITVSIGESGTVQSVQVHGSADFMLIEGCIKNAIRHWRFPSNGEEYATSFPLILQGG
jgi:outer membrane biosynthesis protein TonB